MAQLRPFCSHRVPVQRLPKGSFVLPQATDTPSYQTARTSYEDAGRNDLHCGTARGAKAVQTGSASQLVDYGRDVEDH